MKKRFSRRNPFSKSFQSRSFRQRVSRGDRISVRQLAIEHVEERQMLASDLVDGALKMEPIAAYNLVVDSNAETPATYAPQAAHLAVKVTNTGTTPLTDIVIRMGDLTNTSTGAGTAGVYPVTTITDPPYPYQGNFSLQQEGGISEATRRIPSLAPGESTVAYVLVSYPALDANGDNVTGAAAETWDDLVFNYDIWVQANEGTTPRLVYDERQITARNEISAMANKIQPNTTSKVPDHYLDAIQAALGWRPAPGIPRIPGAYVSEGIWYDLGNVGAGFDNDGDLIPDRNAWMQPVGDANLYDASAQRLVKCYGLVIVKLNDGTEQLIPFEDQLYFMNLPENNTGAVGLVFYEFLPMQYGSSSSLTPYQEVASGYDNEKFNGDFGASGSAVTFTAPNVQFDKSGAPILTLTTPSDAEATFTLSVTNNETTRKFGWTEYGMPPVIGDDIPAGTSYVAGSAAATVLPPGSSVTIRYSTDGGTTWVATEPANPASVTNLQWWLDSALDPTETFAVTFRTAVPWTYTEAVLDNCGGVSLGGGDYALEDCHSIPLSKGLKIGDTVFFDDGTGGGIVGDGVQNGTETGLANIGLSLYADINGNGVLDSTDKLLGTTSTDANGNYEFTDLRDGDYLVVVDRQDADRPAGSVPSTSQIIPITLTNANNMTADFGFSPTLDLEKTLVGTSPVNEGDVVTYALSVTNLVKPEGYSTSEPKTQDLWLSTVSASSTFANASNAAGATTGNYASTNVNGATLIATDPIDPALVDQTSPITHVEAIAHLNSDLPFRSGDTFSAQIFRQGVSVGTFTVTLNAMNAFSGSVAGSPATASEGYISINLSSVTGGWTWTDLTAATTGITITRTESGSGTDPTVYIDRLGFRVTSVAAEDRSGTLYWGDATTTFKVGPQAGGELEVLMTTLPGPVENAAFDSVNSQIWFSIGSTILTRTPDGSTVPGAVDITASATVTGIDVDPYAGHIYWSQANAIRRANLDGTNVTNIVTGLTAVGSIALDHASGQIYWVQSNANKLIIKRANLNGTGVSQLIESSFGSTKNQNARDLELDEATGRLYFTSDINGDPDIVGVINTDGTGGSVLYSGFDTIQGIAIDPNNSTVFWGDLSGIHGGTFSGATSSLVYPKLTGVVELEIPEFEFDFVGTFDANRTLSVVPLSDTYDSTKLEFLGASLSPSSTSVINPTGTVNWDNIGPINAGITKTVYVKFRVLEPAGNANGTADNTATVTNAQLANGLPANNDTDTVTVNVSPTASIGDFIWQEKGANTTYDSGTDSPLPGVKVELLSGTTVVATTYTDATGHYLFDGLAVPDGSSSTYTVRVTPPTGATCIYDATGAFNDESTVTLTNPAGTAGPTDNLSQDFGYTVPNLIYGTVYRDYASNGTLDSTDPGLGTVTVRLMNGTTVVATTTTDANGFYSFGNIAPGSYTLEVLTTSLPAATGTWSQTGETDGTVNNSIPVTVTAGAVIGSKDFGFNLAGTASVGDEVFFDLDQDNIKDAGEEGIPNVNVLIYRDVNRDGIIDPTVDTLVGTDTTDANGNYGFSNLPAGSYIAVVDTNDPDFPDGVSGVSENPQAFSLVDGQNLTTVDFGYFPGNLGAISGNVWHDRDMDAAIDGSETPLAGITVTLYADLNGDGVFVPFRTVVTDANGNYNFDDLPYGDYRVVVDTADTDLPESSGRTFDPTTPSQYTTTLSPTNLDDTFNFGFAGKPSIGDYVFYDANRNGTQDTYEAGIPGVTVKLYEDANGDGVADGPAIASVVTANGTGTDPAGFYQFTNLDPGKYLVEVDTATLPYPMINSADPDRDGVAWLSPADTSGGLPASDSKDTGIDLSYSNYTGADFGYVPRGAIGDFVWLDQDADGVQDPGELGIAGVTVTATFGSTTVTTTTDNDGYYAFANLPAGTWTISISGTPLTGKSATFDADGGTDNSTSVTIDSSGTVTNAFGPLDVDFGLRLSGPYSLSGSVCTNDARTSGVCDDVDNFLDDELDGDAGATDETELAGQTVYLYQKVGSSFVLVATTTTDDAGNYEFTSLPNGDYKVVLNATSVELQNSQLTTTAADTPATALTDNGSSVVQEVTIASANVEGVDFAYVPLVDYDFGDLPDRYVATTLANDGARHIVVSGSNLMLGTSRDSEPNGQPDLDALGDDTQGTDDEDGVVPLNILSWANGANGGSVQVTIPAGETGYLVGWIDFNQDNSLIDLGEMVISQPVTGTGAAQTITFDIPAGTITAGTDYSWMARFRLFPAAPAYPLFSYTGVASDGEVEDYEFNRYQSASLGDRVWLDQDADGVQDPSEWGIPGITVTLKDSSNNVVATQVTSDGTQDVDNDGTIDPVGYYRFPLLATGNYTVEVTVPAKYSLTYDLDSGTSSPDGVAAANVASLGTHLNTLDFGLESPTLSDISGTVYFDANDNNTIGTGDTGLGAVCVQLWTDPNGDGDPSDGVQVAEVMTATDGSYTFENLPAYRYVIIAKDPKGYTPEGDTEGSPTDSRVRVDLGTTNSTGNDFLKDGPTLMSIDGSVYNDEGTGASTDDTFSGSDTKIPGVTLNLYYDANGNGQIDPTDPFVDSTVTDANGDYTFPNLPAGKYLVEEDDPTGLVSDNDTQGLATDNVIAVTLTTGNSTGNDFLDDEAAVSLTVSGTVYNDGGTGPSASNVIDGTDTGISGVTLNLYVDTDGDGVLDPSEAVTPYATTTTAANGTYSFTNVPAGNYILEEVDLTGFFISDNDTQGSPRDNQIALTLTTSNSTGNDFLDDEPLSIGGTVYNDDGIGASLDDTFDANDTTISGVTVKLYVDTNGNGQLDGSEGTTPYATTTTDANGDYSFDSLPAGDYLVEETDPTGFVSDGDTEGSGTDNLIAVQLTTADSTGNDFLDDEPLMTISGAVYNDGGTGPSASNVIDGTDTGISGVTLNLYVDTDGDGVLDPSEATTPYATTTTAANGTYSFTGLPKGDYILKEVDPTGFISDNDTQGAPRDNQIALTLTTSNSTGNNFLDDEPLSISGTVYNDDGIGASLDDTFDPNDTTISGVTVKLYVDTNGNGQLDGSEGTTAYATTTTDANGDYSFDSLPAGDYLVEETDPTGFVTDGDTEGSGTDNLIAVQLTTADATGNDFLDDEPLMTISGTVYNDGGSGASASNVFDGTDTGISGVTLKLYVDTNGNGVLDGSEATTPYATTTTAANGTYSFTGLPKGDYIIQEVDPTGFASEDDTQGVGTDNLIAVTLTTSDSTGNNFLDDESTVSLTISGTVYNDGGTGPSASNVIDGTDTGISGVTLNLYVDTDGDGVLDPSEAVTPYATTTTAANGTYSFTGVPAGSYILKEVDPTGFISDNDTQGSPRDSQIALTLTTSNSTGNDFLDDEPLSISGTVYNDDGIGASLDDTFDPNDTTISGVTLKLYVDTNGNGQLDGSEGTTALATTTTDANGDYSFGNLSAGNYLVVETDPTGFVTDGDTEGSGTDNLIAVQLTTTDSTGNDFLDDEPLMTISGTVYNDGGTGVSSSNVIDGTDVGMSGVTLKLYVDTDGDGVLDPGEATTAYATTTTAANGTYSFTGLPKGDYIIVETDPTGFISDNDTQGAPRDNQIALTLTTSNSTGNNFLDDEALSISGRVLNDEGIGPSLNNQFSGNDTGMSGVTISLYEDTDGNGVIDLSESSGTPYATTTTDASGNYSFGNLRPGVWGIQETDPTGFVSDKDTQGASGTDNWIVVTLTTSNSTGNNFLDDEPLVSISGTVYNDGGTGSSPGNTFDAADTGLSGVTIKLYEDTDGDGVLDPSEAVTPYATTTTAANGTYSFTGLPAGDYIIQEVDPTGFVSEADTQGASGTDNLIAVTLTTSDSTGNNFLDDEASTAPVAVNDSRSNLRPGPAAIRIGGNDSDPDPNTTLDLNCIDLDPTTTGQQTTYTVSGEGTWRLGTGGQVTFFPQAGFTEDPTPISYTICNTGGATSNVATITLDYAPVASNDSSFNNPTGTPVTLDIVLNDTKGDPVDPTTVKIQGTANPGDPLVVPGQGTWTVNPTTGAITFTPQSGFTGDPTPIRYTVRDYDGNLSNVATVTVTYVKPCTGFPLTLTIDDLSTPGIDHIIVDGSPVGTSTVVGASTLLDAAPETQGQVSFSGSTAKFSFVKVQALSKPFLTGASPDIQITAAFKSSAPGQIVVKATDGCYGVTSGSPQQLVSPIGGTTNGKVVFKETVDWQNRQFGQAGSTTKTNNYTTPAPGAFSGQPSSSFTPAQPWVSLTKQVNVTHGRANQLTTLNAGGKILPLVAGAVSQSFVGLHPSPWTSQELVGLPQVAQSAVVRRPVEAAVAGQQTLFGGKSAEVASVNSRGLAIDEVMRGWDGSLGDGWDSSF